MTELWRDRIVAAICGAAFLAFLLTNADIPNGYDAYRHVRMAARLLSEPQDVFRDPWHHAYLWPKPVDSWFGYHLLLAPFTRVFDLIVAIKVFSSILIGLLVFVLLRIFSLLQIRDRILWVMIALAGSGITFNRLGCCRPFLFSILLVLTAGLYTLKGNRIAIALTAALHALVYSMFFLVAMAPGVWLLLRRDKRSLQVALSCMAGIAIGLLANPYFPENVKWDIVNASVIGIADRAGVEIGGELYPMKITWLAASIPVFGLWLGAVVLRLKNWRAPGHPAADLFLAISCVVLAASILCGRTFDFYVPFAALFAATVLTPYLERRRQLALPLWIACSLLCASHIALAWVNGRATTRVESYRAASSYLKTHAASDVVANARWGSYYYLYFWNAQSRYVAGIEPTMAYLMDSRKYWLWRHMSDDETSTCDRRFCAGEDRVSLASAMRNELGARFIFTEHARHPHAEAALRGSAGVKEVFRDADFSIFELRGVL